MMFKKIIASVAIAFILFSCAENKQQKEVPATVIKMDTAATQNAAFKNLPLDSKKDLVCGMPVTAGISDTTHYKGKLYGFCSKECKDEFLKNPAQYLVGK